MAKAKIKSAVGIEFTGDRINLVKLAKSPQGAVLLGAKSIKFYVSKKEDEKKILSENIVKAFEGLDYSKDELALGVGGHMSFVRKVKLPPVSHSKLKQVISFEIQQQVPFSLDEVIWDYQVISPFSKIPGPIVVLIAAIKQSFVDDLLKIVRDSTTKVPDVVDTSSIALHNCLVFNGLLPKEKVGILVNLGFSYTEVSIESKGEIAFTRAVPIGRKNILRKIMELKNVEIEKADEILSGQGQTVEEGVSRAISSVWEDLIAEIKRTTNYYLSQVEKVTNFQYIYVCGDFPKSSNLLELLKNSFRVEVKEIDPFNKISRSADSLPYGAGNFCVSVGLALRTLEHFPVEINLLPKNLLSKKKLANKKMFFIASLAVLFLTGCFILVSGARSYNLTREKISIMAPILNSYEPYMSKIEELKRARAKIISQLEDIKAILKQKSQLSEILLEVSNLTPADIYVTEISTSGFASAAGQRGMDAMPEGAYRPEDMRTVPNMMDEMGSSQQARQTQPQPTASVSSESKISLKGVTASYPAVDEYIKQLKTSSLFKTVELISVSSAPGTGQSGGMTQPTAAVRGSRATTPPSTGESAIQREKVNFTLEMGLVK